MPSRLEIELPYPGDTMPFGELEVFVKNAIHAGASADTPVSAVPVVNNDEMIDALRIEFGSIPTPVRTDLEQLLELLAEVERNDGDVGAQHRALQEIRRRLIGDQQQGSSEA